MPMIYFLEKYPRKKELKLLPIISEATEEKMEGTVNNSEK